MGLGWIAGELDDVSVSCASREAERSEAELLVDRANTDALQRVHDDGCTRVSLVLCDHRKITTSNLDTHEKIGGVLGKAWGCSANGWQSARRFTDLQHARRRRHRFGDLLLLACVSARTAARRLRRPRRRRAHAHVENAVGLGAVVPAHVAAVDVDREDTLAPQLAQGVGHVREQRPTLAS